MSKSFILCVAHSLFNSCICCFVICSRTMSRVDSTLVRAAFVSWEASACSLRRLHSSVSIATMLSLLSPVCLLIWSCLSFLVSLPFFSTSFFRVNIAVFHSNRLYWLFRIRWWFGSFLRGSSSSSSITLLLHPWRHLISSTLCQGYFVHYPLASVCDVQTFLPLHLSDMCLTYFG